MMLGKYCRRGEQSGVESVAAVALGWCLKKLMGEAAEGAKGMEEELEKIANRLKVFYSMLFVIPSITV